MAYVDDVALRIQDNAAMHLILISGSMHGPVMLLMEK